MKKGHDITNCPVMDERKPVRPFSEILFSLLDKKVIRSIAKRVLGRIVFNRDICIHVRGVKIYTNTVDRLLAAFMWKFSYLEAFETEIIGKIIKPGMVVADIGANIGYYTLLMAQMVGPTGIVYAFEPEPNNYRLLVKNIAANFMLNVIPVSKAVSDRTGKVKLYICREHRGDHKIFAGKDDRPSIEVDQVTMDDYFRNNPKLDLIKMDIQGSEHMVIKGFEKIDAANGQLILLTEFSPELLRESGGDPEKFLHDLKQYGFSTKLIDEKTKQLRPITITELMSSCQGPRYENLLLEKK